MSGSVNGLSNGGLDPSIPLQAGRGVPQPNPLGMIGQYANTANALNQLRLFPGQQQLQQQAIQGGATSLAQQNYRAAYGSLAPLLAKPQGTITVDDVATGLGSAEQNLGLVTQPVLQDILTNAPPPNTPAYDAYIRSRVASMSQGNNENAVAQVTRHPGPTFDTGQQLIPTTVGGAGLPNTGVPVPTGQNIQTYPSRGQLIGQVQWTDQNGTVQYGTQADYAAARGLNPLLGPAVPVQQGGAVPGGAAPGAPSPIGTGRLPPSLLNPANQPTGGSTAGAVPGTPAYLAASAGHADTANARAANFQSDMYPLMQAQTALANAPSGKGSDAAHDVSSYINTFAPPMLTQALHYATLGVTMSPEEVSAYDEAKKYLTQGTLGTAGATRSNEGLTTAGAASPSTTISKEAAQLVLRGMIGLRRMDQESTLEFNNSGLPPAAYNAFQTKFATNADPRVYMFDQMAPAQRAQLIQSMPKAAQTKFWDQVNTATQNGILTPPQAAAQP